MAKSHGKLEHVSRQNLMALCHVPIKKGAANSKNARNVEKKSITGANSSILRTDIIKERKAYTENFKFPLSQGSTEV